MDGQLEPAVAGANTRRTFPPAAVVRTPAARCRASLAGPVSPARAAVVPRPSTMDLAGFPRTPRGTHSTPALPDRAKPCHPVPTCGRAHCTLCCTLARGAEPIAPKPRVLGRTRARVGWVLQDSNRDGPVVPDRAGVCPDRLHTSLHTRRAAPACATRRGARTPRFGAHEIRVSGTAEPPDREAPATAEWRLAEARHEAAAVGAADAALGHPVVQSAGTFHASGTAALARTTSKPGSAGSVPAVHDVGRRSLPSPCVNADFADTRYGQLAIIAKWGWPGLATPERASPGHLGHSSVAMWPRTVWWADAVEADGLGDRGTETLDGRGPRCSAPSIPAIPAKRPPASCAWCRAAACGDAGS